MEKAIFHLYLVAKLSLKLGGEFHLKKKRGKEEKSQFSIGFPTVIYILTQATLRYRNLRANTSDEMSGFSFILLQFSS